MLGDVDAGVASMKAAVDAAMAARGRIAKLDELEAWESYANGLNAARGPGAIEAARQTVALAKEIHGQAFSMPMLGSRVNLAIALGNEGQHEAAIGELASILADIQKLFGPDHPRVAMVAGYLGGAQLRAGRTAAAVESYRTSLQVAEKEGKGGTINLARVASRLGEALLADRRAAEALPQCDPRGAHLRRGFRAARRAAPAGLARPRAGARRSRLARRGRRAARRARCLGRRGRSGVREARRRRAAQRPGTPRRSRRAGARRRRRDLGPQASKLARAEADRVLGLALLGAGRTDEAGEALARAVQLYREAQIASAPAQVETVAALERARPAAASR